MSVDSDLMAAAEAARVAHVAWEAAVDAAAIAETAEQTAHDRRAQRLADLANAASLAGLHEPSFQYGGLVFTPAAGAMAVTSMPPALEDIGGGA